ncbi:hypothetical protein [Arsukibacterium sp.]|uniref:hypothetical protein n=1 Tax=Arsukibacterium sp. TaxID=1977258 RepID=UPI00299CFFB6|nr:hypothetical protein [Arsukibacterium sp.]MDX1538815.1 hypothetical protein [Arsukibacterium sp.]
MQTIPVIYSRNNKPFSYAIRLLDKGALICPFSHVAIVSKCGTFVYEARGGYGVIKTPIQEFKARATYWEEGFFPVICRAEAYRRAESQQGKEYDLMGAVVIGLPFIPHHWADPEKWFCSEYLAYCSQMFEAKHISFIGVNFCYALTHSKPLPGISFNNKEIQFESAV